MPPPAPLRPTDAELRRLYLDERLTARDLGKRFNVRHITILRWLKAADVERRAASRGLDNRGIIAPTADELRDMVHVQHLSYVQIAAIYGVDFTAVPHWLVRHGIPKPTLWETRRKGKIATEPTEVELRERLAAGESLHSIALDYDVTRSTLGTRCQQYGITVQPDGWQGGRRLPCTDGHEARSVYEQRVDDWLYKHGVEHYTEPAYPWDRRYRADFRVGATYIEVWGVTENAPYLQRKALKIAGCKTNGIDLIQIGCWQFAEGRKWWRPLQRLVSNQT